MLRTILATLSLATVTLTASELSDAAKALQPGQWVQLQTKGADPVICKNNGGDILEYSNQGVWDPIAKRVYYMGASHHGAFVEECAQYDEKTNTWTSIPLPGPNMGVTHGYSHNAFDTKRQQLYFRIFASTAVLRYDVATAGWSTLQCPSGINTTCVMQYFPDIDRIVCYADNGGDVNYFDPSKNSWEQTNVGKLEGGGVHSMCMYSHLGFMLAGGGNQTNKLYRRDAKANEWKAIADAPCRIRNTNSILTEDPVSGWPLLLCQDDGKLYEYDPTKDIWAAKGTCPLTAGVSAIAIAIPDHGVVMMPKTVNSQTQVEVWLYKHSEAKKESAKKDGSKKETKKKD